jgi:hypothetical protein
VALHPRREVFVGYPTVQTIIGNKFAPDLLDHYLARTGYKGQQTKEAADPERKDNLYAPLPGDHGAHGNFNAQAWDVSPQFWAASNKGLVAGALAVLGFGLGWLVARKTRN